MSREGAGGGVGSQWAVATQTGEMHWVTWGEPKGRRKTRHIFCAVSEKVTAEHPGVVVAQVAGQLL